MLKAVETYIEENNIVDNDTNEGVMAGSDNNIDVDTKTVLDQDVKWSLDGKKINIFLLWVIYIDF